jgi:hypothetical protein
MNSDPVLSQYLARGRAAEASSHAAPKRHTRI